MASRIINRPVPLPGVFTKTLAITGTQNTLYLPNLGRFIISLIESGTRMALLMVSVTSQGVITYNSAFLGSGITLDTSTANKLKISSSTSVTYNVMVFSSNESRLAAVEEVTS